MWPASLVLRLWWRTLRIEMPPGDLAVIHQTERPMIFVLWHNRLFISPDIIRRYRRKNPLYSLISASKDGDWLAALFAVVGVGAIRGSSSKQGREAAASLVEALKAGRDIGITPDGPRGPVYVMKPGAVVVARRSAAFVALVGMDFESAWRVSSWDGFYLPKPFSRIRMSIRVDDLSGFNDVDEAARLMGERLAALNPDRTSAPVRTKASA